MYNRLIMNRTTTRKKKAKFIKLIKKKIVKKNVGTIFNSLPQTIKTAYDSDFFKKKAKREPITFARKKLQGFHINNTTEFPGCALYLPMLEYNENFKQLVVQIKAFEQHIVKNTNIYDLQKIYKQHWFYVCAEFLINDIEFISSWPEFIRGLHENPTLVLSCLGLGMYSVITHFAPVCSNHLKFDQYNLKHFKNIKKIFPRPLNKFTVNGISEISHNNYNKLCVVQGRVTSITPIEIKCTGITYQCRKCGCKQVILQASHITKPLKCRIQCNSRNFTIVCSSPYTQIDCMQMIELYITEPENYIYHSHRIDIELRQELVDLVCVGSNIEVIGVIKAKSLSETHKLKFLKGHFRNAFIQAVNIKKIEDRRNLDTAQHDDFQIVKNIAKAPNCLQLLMRSLAPETCGLENVKFALLLSLLGGSGTQLEDEGKLDVLIVGDPGMSKLDLLKNAAIFSNSGRLKWGNKDIKIQSAEEQLQSSCNLSKQNFINDECTSPSYNEHYCIDDIEKLSSNKESLIHFMQTKCMTERTTSNMLNVAPGASIIASINPTEGHFNSSKLFRENVCLSPSLLSLFHLIFVLYDKASKNRDTILTEHVKVLHSTKCKTKLNPSKFSAVPNSTLGFAKSNFFDDNLTEPLNLLPTILLKKYIACARTTINPILAKDVLAEIKNFYLGLRNEKNNKDNFSFTSRQLDGFIILTQARARTELAQVVTKEHIDDIIELIYHCYADTHFIEGFISSPNKFTVDALSGSQMKQLIRFLEVKSNSLGKVIFSVEELKDIAICAGISSDITKIIEIMNLHGYLLKKGTNLYQIKL